MANESIRLRDTLAQAAHDAFCVPLSEARHFAQGFVDCWVQDHGGSPVYLGKRTTTDDEILADFTGANFAEVCAKHGISQRTLKRKISHRQGQPSGAAPLLDHGDER